MTVRYCPKCGSPMMVNYVYLTASCFSFHCENYHAKIPIKIDLKRMVEYDKCKNQSKI